MHISLKSISIANTLVMLMMGVILVGCRHDVKDERLIHVAEIVSDSAGVALSELDGINPDELSESDRQYRNLLIVKATDKAYLPHRSDSLIMSVVEYAERHKGQEWRPEALYYAGRVYADLGDSPTALRYFHEALDAMPVNDMNLDLKSSILSQTGRLLYNIRLYDDALEYVCQSIEIDKLKNDTHNLVYDYQLAGDINLRKKNYREAERCFMSALKLSEGLDSKMRAKSRMYLAAVKYKEQSMDSALNLIRLAVDSVSNAAKPTALGYAAKIYYANGITDTAFSFSRMLISPRIDGSNRHVAYQILLEKDMRILSASDSIDSYISSYSELLNDFLNDTQRQLAVTQQSVYNYSLHERKRILAENSRKNLQLWLLAMAMTGFALLSIVLFVISRNRNQLIKLRQAIYTIDRLQNDLNRLREPINEEDSVEVTSRQDRPTLSISGLREQMQTKIRRLSETVKNTEIRLLITHDLELYEKIKGRTDDNKSLKDEDEIWDEIERLVLSEYPEFRNNLILLSNGKIKKDLYRTALLIKCGISPTHISVLMARSKPAISQRRKKIAELCFDEELELHQLDLLIRLL